MSIFFFDSMAHYTTNAELLTKWDANFGSAPVASSGAFGYYGVRPNNDAMALMVNFPSVTTLELSAYFIAKAQFGQWIEFWNGSNIQLRFHIFSDGHMNAVRGTSPDLGSSAAAAISFGVQHHLHIKIVFSQTVGTIDVKIDGVNILSLSGQDTSAEAVADCTQLRLFGGGSSNVADCIWSHVALGNAAGDITGRPRVQAVFPDGAGNYSQWNRLSGAANYEMVDEQFPDEDTTYVYESTVNDRDSYLYSNFLATTDTVLAVAVVPRARTDDAASRSIKTFVRAAGADHDHPDTVAVPGSYGYLQQIYQVNPATGLAWTPAEVNAIEAGIKVVS